LRRAGVSAGKVARRFGSQNAYRHGGPYPDRPRTPGDGGAAAAPPAIPAANCGEPAEVVRGFRSRTVMSAPQVLTLVLERTPALHVFSRSAPWPQSFRARQTAQSVLRVRPRGQSQPVWTSRRPQSHHRSYCGLATATTNDTGRDPLPAGRSRPQRPVRRDTARTHNPNGSMRGTPVRPSPQGRRPRRDSPRRETATENGGRRQREPPVSTSITRSRLRATRAHRQPSIGSALH